jgi:hypothetical protein
LYAVASVLLKTNWYYYLRNLSIVYSVFSFFVGYYLYEDQYEFFSKMRKAIYGYALICFAWMTPGLIDRNAYSFWFSLLQKNWKLTSVLMLIVLYILYVIAYTSLTVIIILLAVALVRYTKSYAYFKLIVVISILAFISVFIMLSPYMKLYHNGSYNLFGDVLTVYAQHPLFRIDQNSSWRLVFWYRTVVETFPQNLLGIGLGTPLLPYLPSVTTTDLNFSDEYIAHVIGTHNTFITMFVRFGILTVLIFAVIYRTICREYFIHKKYYLHNRNDGGLFLGFVTMTAVGLFNLVLESPTLASLYWISLGFVAKAIYLRRVGNNEVSPL